MAAGGAITHAMVLAAGLGTRMRLLTEMRPKALIEVAGQALIDRTLDRLAAAGVETAVVNTHHLAALLEAHLAPRRRPAIEISHEARLLETGGGVAHALPRLGTGPFYVVNSDILWLDGPLAAPTRLGAAWDGSRMDALLLLVPLTAALGYEGPGDFERAPSGRLARRTAARASYVFAGLQVLHPRLLTDAPAGAYSLNRLYDRALAAGRLFGLVHDGGWYHIGTPRALAAADAALRAPPNRRVRA